MKYTIGIDFGTLSARAVLVETKRGTQIACAEAQYPHGVIDKVFRDGRILKVDTALADAEDYILVLEQVLSEVLIQASKQDGFSRDDVIAIGLDVTSSTILPTLADGRPLSVLPELRNEPHAYVKLWKHHSARSQTEKINRVAREREERFLGRYGGEIQSEWVLPKVLEVLEEAPEVYERADCFIEMADYLVWHLTGQCRRSACTSGYKAMWEQVDEAALDALERSGRKEIENERRGYPSQDFYAAVDPRLRDFVQKKLFGEVIPVCSAAGYLREELADRLGLSKETVVSSGYVDAHAAVPALGVTEEGTLVSILGTSACHMLLDRRGEVVSGTNGYVRDGIIPGFCGYEAGQPSFGDTFAWWMENALPSSCEKEAAQEGISVHELLARKAGRLAVGENGLLALDWWNGNRSILNDYGLSGLLVGLTLQTSPEAIYRALIEAVCFGARAIVENYRSHGLEVRKMIATGGIALKNPLLMQIMADVLQCPVNVAATEQGGALGSAIASACAAGEALGGYASMQEACAHMGSPILKTYQPRPENAGAYQTLYEKYMCLYNLFGRKLTVMQELKNDAAACGSSATKRQTPGV